MIDRRARRGRASLERAFHGAILFCGLAGCAGSEAAPLAFRQSSLTSFVHFERSILLEESESVINVSPRVEFDPRGGFVVADPQEGQVRLYSRDGSLVSFFGRRGQGPGEFQRVIGAVRVPSGRVVAADMGGRISVLDSAATRLLATAEVPIWPMHHLEPMGSGHVVLTGRLRGSPDSPLVHVWDSEQLRLVASFAPPPVVRPELAPGYLFAGSAAVAVRGDTVAVLFSLADSIALYTRQGTLLQVLPIPYRFFRPMREAMPDEPVAVRAWGQTFSSASNLFWLADGSFLVQYLDVAGVPGMGRWSLFAMTRGGNPLFELLDTPRLLTTDGRNGLVFLSPGVEEPNAWTLARLER